MRVENQPYGRLNEIIYDQAFTVHPYKHPTIGSMAGPRGRVDRRRARLLPHVLRADERDADDRRRLRFRRRRCSWCSSTSAACRSRRSRCRATSRASRRRRRRSASRSRRPGRCRRSSSRTTSPTTATPTRIRCTWRRRSCPTARARASTASWSTRQRLALTAFGGGNIIEDPNLFYAVAIVQPGHTPADVEKALIAELDRMRDRAGQPSTSCSAPRTSSPATTSSARETNQQKAAQLAHAVVIHNDITTADGEFDIFQNITSADIQRVAQTYFTPTNRLVMHDHAEGADAGVTQ